MKFNLGLYKPGMKVQTAAGKDVRLICTDMKTYNNMTLVVGLMSDVSYDDEYHICIVEHVFQWEEDGSLYDYDYDDMDEEDAEVVRGFNLVFKPMTYYQIVYKEEHDGKEYCVTDSKLYESEEELKAEVADKFAGNYVGISKIEMA